MAGSFEHFLVSQNRSVHAENIVTFLDIAAPPDFFDITLQLGSEWAEIPTTIEAAIEFAGLEDEALAFAEGHDFFHADGVGLVFVCHSLLYFWEAELSRANPRKQGRGRSEWCCGRNLNLPRRRGERLVPYIVDERDFFEQ